VCVGVLGLLCAWFDALSVEFEELGANPVDFFEGERLAGIITKEFIEKEDSFLLDRKRFAKFAF